MQIVDIKKIHSRTISALNARNISDALPLLRDLLHEANSPNLTDEFLQLIEAYHPLITYFAQGVADDQRERLYSEILSHLYHLADHAVAIVLTEQSKELFYIKRQTSDGLRLNSLVEAYQATSKKIEILSSADVADTEMIERLQKERERTMTDIFNYLWITFPLQRSEYDLVRSILTNSQANVDASQLFIAAILLSSIQFFDEQKLKLLFSTYIEEPTLELRARCIVSIVLILHIYKKRCEGMPWIQLLLDRCAELPYFTSDLMLVYRLFTKAKNTERMRRRIETDFIPGFVKANQDFKSKTGYDIRQPNKTSLEEDELADWLDKTGLTKKIEEFTELQMQGEDMLISTFANLKSFPFFQTLSNWFRPFSLEAANAIQPVEPATLELIGTLIDNTPMLCNSDRYSLLYSINTLPDTQKTAILQQLRTQFDGITKQQNKVNTTTAGSIDVTLDLFIKDLYRFFNLYTRHAELFPIFDQSFNLIENTLFQKYISGHAPIEAIANYLLKNEFYNDASLHYHWLLEHNPSESYTYYEALGDIANANSEPIKAMDMYQLSELAGEPSLSLMTKIAQTYRVLGRFADAIKYYGRIQDAKPNSIQLAMTIGHCYLQNGNPKTALQYYYKADVLSEKGSERTWRPIAWCLLLLKDFEKSYSYYEKIMQSGKATINDKLNFGHLYTIERKFNKAIDLYKQVLQMSGDKERFISMINNDSSYLIDAGIKKWEISLIINAVTFYPEIIDKLL